MINANIVALIDNIPTIIRRVKDNVASGNILHYDFTTEKCFVVKDDQYFAHGKTIKDAFRALTEKRLINMNTEKAIEEFCKKFEKGKSYKGSEFFDWHHYLTGSCLTGREAFVKNVD